MPDPKFNVAICGGGVGGLALAAFLSQKSNITVDIYEGKPQISALGEAIAIWKRSWQVLQDIGLDEALSERNIPPPKEGEARGPVFRKSDQPEEGYDFHSHVMPYGPLSIPRPILLDMLQSKLGPNCTVHTSKLVTSLQIEETGLIALQFADNTVRRADIVIGADGGRSLTREFLYRTVQANSTSADAKTYERYIKQKWSGTLCYRCNVSAERLKALYPEHQALIEPKIWCGKNKHVVTYPFGPTVYVVGYFTQEGAEGSPFSGSLVADVSAEEVINRYEGWEPDLCNMLQLIEKPSRWAIHVVDPLPFSVSDRVALLGDAAHAMTPHQGVGGGQAIEDAHLLGHLLSHPDTDLSNIQQVLRIYQEIRLPLAQAAAERSRINGLMYEFNHPDYLVSSKAECEELGKAVGKSFEWLAQGGCDKDWDNAQQQLKQVVAK